MLIVGVDPGTTTAYAVFDTEGNFIKVESERNISSSKVISELVKTGRILVISCDVSPPPKVVGNISRKLGAVLFVPEKTLPLNKKTRLVDEWLKKQKDFIKINNKHERDAMASALFAYKQIRKLFDKVKEEVGEGLSEKVKEKVLKGKIAIKKVAGSLVSA